MSNYWLCHILVFITSPKIVLLHFIINCFGDNPTGQIWYQVAKHFFIFITWKLGPCNNLLGLVGVKLKLVFHFLFQNQPKMVVFKIIDLLYWWGLQKGIPIWHGQTSGYPAKNGLLQIPGFIYMADFRDINHHNPVFFGS